MLPTPYWTAMAAFRQWSTPLICLIIGVFLLFNCSDNGGRVTLRYMTWDSATGLEPERKIIQQFEATHPDIEVKLEPNSQGYEDKIITSLVAGKPPDVFLWWNFTRLAELGGIEDLTSYLERCPDLSAGMFYPNLLRYTSVKGRIYGLPKDFTARVIFYNKDLFDQAGLPYPKDDWTWDEFLEVAKKLTYGDQYGFYVSAGTYHLQPWVWSNGGDLISPDGKHVLGYLDSPETIEAVKFYTDLCVRYGVSPSGGVVSSLGGALNMFLTGKLAMMDNGRWPVLKLKKSKIRFGTVLPPHPRGKKLVTVLHCAGQVMAAIGKHKPQAWELLKAMSDPNAQRIRAEAGWALPAMPALTKEMGLEKDPIESTFIRAIKYATVTPCFLRTSHWWEYVDKPLTDAIDKILLKKGTVEEVLPQTARRIERQLREIP